MLPTLGKTLGLSALSGLASEGASQIVKKISGKGFQTGGLIIPYNRINELMPCANMFTTKQQKDIIKALQMGEGLHIYPSKKQSGGFLGSLLASIGIQMAIDLVKNMISGKEAPIMGLPKINKTNGKGAPRLGLPKMPPPFYSYPPYVTGKGIKRKAFKKIRERLTIRKKQSIQQYPNTRSNIVKLKFHKNIPMTNHDLIKWCEYLHIPIKDVLARDQTVPHNHKQTLFIYNLEPSYMPRSHWVATYVKDGIINYFDSFGMPPFQEIVNHARKENITLLHQNNQIQNIMKTTCGYFCLYFLNETNKGNSYYDLLKVFNIHDTMANENLLTSILKISKLYI